jgi:hypothetical protein
MNPYFFDIVTSACVEYDFHGHSLATPDDARDLAELIALDLECSDKVWIATEVVVRDVKGARLHSVNIRHPDLIAA